MKVFCSLLVGFILGFALHWYLVGHNSQDVVTRAKDSLQQTASNLGESVRQTFDTGKIKDEMARTGRVVREKAGQVGAAIADATTNARITATIKAKLVADSGLSGFKISVDTTDGVVTLSGTVSSYDAIARAMDLALEVDGVQRVISTLQVQP